MPVSHPGLAATARTGDAALAINGWWVLQNVGCKVHQRDEAALIGFSFTL